MLIERARVAKERGLVDGELDPVQEQPLAVDQKRGGVRNVFRGECGDVVAGVNSERNALLRTRKHRHCLAGEIVLELVFNLVRNCRVNVIQEVRGIDAWL